MKSDRKKCFDSPKNINKQKIRNASNWTTNVSVRWYSNLSCIFTSRPTANLQFDNIFALKQYHQTHITCFRDARIGIGPKLFSLLKFRQNSQSSIWSNESYSVLGTITFILKIEFSFWNGMRNFGIIYQFHCFHVHILWGGFLFKCFA